MTRSGPGRLEEMAIGTSIDVVPVPGLHLPGLGAYLHSLKKFHITPTLGDPYRSSLGTKTTAADPRLDSNLDRKL